MTGYNDMKIGLLAAGQGMLINGSDAAGSDKNTNPMNESNSMNKMSVDMTTNSNSKSKSRKNTFMNIINNKFRNQNNLDAVYRD